MATVLNTRIPPQTVQADIDAFVGLKGIIGYTPVNQDYSLDAVSRLHDALRKAQETEIHTQNAHAAARDAMDAIERDFHDAILGVKSQVKAQFGPDSDQVAALGLKKKSDRRRSPTRAGKEQAGAA